MKSLCSGSPFYIAPEIFKGKVSLPCDMWSIGVVMYLCLSGKLPFPGETTEEIFKNVMYKEINLHADPDLQNISDESKDLMSLMLERDPTKRITPVDALAHPWFELFEEGGRMFRDSISEKFRG